MLTLRRRVLAHPERLQDLELAAEAKLKEGRVLRSHGLDDGAIYLLGFTAEMVLKFAFFRYNKEPLSREVRPLLRPARHRAGKLIPRVNDDRYHSILFWGMLLRKQRRLDGYRWAETFDHGFVRAIRRIHQNWTIEMRYQSGNGTETEAKNVEDEVAWLFRNRLWLWRI